MCIQFRSAFVVAALSLFLARDSFAEDPPPTPAELLKEYEAHGLPLPPKLENLCSIAGLAEVTLMAFFSPRCIIWELISKPDQKQKNRLYPEA